MRRLKRKTRWLWAVSGLAFLALWGALPRGDYAFIKHAELTSDRWPESCFGEVIAHERSYRVKGASSDLVREARETLKSDGWIETNLVKDGIDFHRTQNSLYELRVSEMWVWAELEEAYPERKLRKTGDVIIRLSERWKLTALGRTLSHWFPTAR